jgi:hypothetical protein
VVHEGIVIQMEGHALSEVDDVSDRILPSIVHYII